MPRVQQAPIKSSPSAKMVSQLESQMGFHGIAWSRGAGIHGSQNPPFGVTSAARCHGGLEDSAGFDVKKHKRIFAFVCF